MTTLQEQKILSGVISIFGCINIVASGFENLTGKSVRKVKLDKLIAILFGQHWKLNFQKFKEEGFETKIIRYTH